MAAVVHGNAKETGMEKKLIKYPGNTAKRKTLYNVLDIKLNSVLFFFWLLSFSCRTVPSLNNVHALCTATMDGSVRPWGRIVGDILFSLSLSLSLSLVLCCSVSALPRYFSADWTTTRSDGVGDSWRHRQQQRRRRRQQQKKNNKKKTRNPHTFSLSLSLSRSL